MADLPIRPPEKVVEAIQRLRARGNASAAEAVADLWMAHRRLNAVADVAVSAASNMLDRERSALDGYVDTAAPTLGESRPDTETAAVLRAVWTLCNNTEGGSRPARGREVERLSEALTDWECEHGDIHGPHGWNLPAKDDEGAEPDSWSFDPPDRVGGES